MIRLLLSTPPGLELRAAKAILEAAGIHVRRFAQESSASTKDSWAVDDAVLVSPEASVVPLGDALDRFRSRLAPETPVLLCAPQAGARDRQFLIDQGARKVIEPATWSDEGVAERILGELLGEGKIQPSSCGSLVGGTPEMGTLYGQIARLAPIKDPVLILGETGAGKGVVAEEIHRQSSRPGKLLAINVAAMSPELMASDLFGHERGAFTGATTRRKGLLTRAGDGTVFLDEIGELDPASQTKLLRVLEDFRVRPVGANDWQPVSARILLATNRDLEADCSAGRFRQDLYERIRGLPLEIPPLRRHKADIPLLVEHFLDVVNRERGTNHTLPYGAVDVLFRHDWPGNVRELLLAVRQAAIFASGPDGPISKEHLRAAVRRRPQRPAAEPNAPGVTASAAEPTAGSVTIDPEKHTLRDARDRAEVVYLKRALELAGGKPAAACKLADMSTSQFYALLRKHGLG